MKQINCLILLLTILVLPITFVACSKEDEEPSSKGDSNNVENGQGNNQIIVGYWIEDPTYREEENTAYIFQANGKYVELWYHYTSIDEKLIGTYDISGGRLNLYYGGDKEGKDYSDSHNKIIFAGSKMILTEDDGDKSTFYKVSELSGYFN